MCKSFGVITWLVGVYTCARVGYGDWEGHIDGGGSEVALDVSGHK